MILMNISFINQAHRIKQTKIRSSNEATQRLRARHRLLELRHLLEVDPLELYVRPQDRSQAVLSEKVMRNSSEELEFLSYTLPSTD